MAFDFGAFIETEIQPIILDALITIAWALLVVVIGLLLIRLIRAALRRFLGHSKVSMSPSMIGFLISVVSVGLKIFLVLAVFDMLNISILGISAFIAFLGIGLGNGLSDAIGNLVAGAFIMVQKPIKQGDFICVGGTSGTVVEIGVTHTRVLAGDREMYFVPNNHLVTSVLRNDETSPVRRMSIPLSIAYGENVRFVRSLVLREMARTPGVITDDPDYPIQVFVSEWNHSSVDLTARCFAKQAHFWSVNRYLKERLLNLFYEYGVEIPFPQTDVHLYKEEKPAPRDSLDEKERDELKEILDLYAPPLAAIDAGVEPEDVRASASDFGNALKGKAAAAKATSTQLAKGLVKKSSKAMKRGKKGAKDDVELEEAAADPEVVKKNQEMRE